MEVTLVSLGEVLSTLGRRDEAEAAYREALDIQRTSWGSEHPAIASTLIRLGGLLWNRGRLAEAESTYRQAVDMRKRLLGDEHPYISSGLHFISKILIAEGKLPQAEEVLREALDKRRRSLGGAHADVHKLVDSLGKVLRAQGKVAELEAFYRQALLNYRSASSNAVVSESPWLGTVLCDFAVLLRQRNLTDEARAFAEEAMDMYSRHVDWPFAERYNVFKVLHAILSDLGDASALQAMRRKETPKLQAALQAELQQGDIAKCNNLAWLLATSSDAAIRDGTNAIAFAEKAVSGTHRTNSMYLDTLAAAYAEAGDFTKAAGVQKEAIILLHDEAEKKDFTSRLKLYESNTPYREN